MTKCAVQHCQGRGGHLFPKDPKIRQKWLAFAGRTSVGCYAQLCKAHFREDDFILLPVIRGLPRPRKRLKPNAVPSVRDHVRSSQEAAFSKTVCSTSKQQPICTDKAAKIHLTYLQLEKLRKDSVHVVSEKELFRLVEHIKQKLVDNAPRSAEFPSFWNEPPKKKKALREGYPPFSMPCLIALAIESDVLEIATKNKIIRFIGLNFPCYKLDAERGQYWQDRVGEILETCKVFRKLVTVEKSPSIESQTEFWTFAPEVNTIISTDLYEALTNARFDDSTLDYEKAAVELVNQAISTEKTEDMVLSRISDIKEDLNLDDSNDHFSEIDQLESPRVDNETEPETDRLKKKRMRKAAETSRKSEENVCLEGDVPTKRKKTDKTEASNDGPQYNLNDCPPESDLLEKYYFSDDSEVLHGDTDSDGSENPVKLTLFNCGFCKFVSLSDSETTAHMLENHSN